MGDDSEVSAIAVVQDIDDFSIKMYVSMEGRVYHTVDTSKSQPAFSMSIWVDFCTHFVAFPEWTHFVAFPEWPHLGGLLDPFCSFQLDVAQSDAAQSDTAHQSDAAMFSPFIRGYESYSLSPSALNQRIDFSELEQMTLTSSGLGLKGLSGSLARSSSLKGNRIS